MNRESPQIAQQENENKEDGDEENRQREGAALQRGGEIEPGHVECDNTD